MELDRSILNEAPSLNDVVYKWFKAFPIYLRHDFLGAHSYSMHVQPGIELNVTLEGQGTFVVDQQILKQTPGQLLVFSGKLPHQVFIDPSTIYTRMVMLIDDKSLASLLPNADYYVLTDIACRQLKLPPETFIVVKHLLFDMHNELQAKKTGWQQMLVSGLMHLAIIVKRCLEAGLHEHGRTKPAKRRRKDDPLAELCGYIHRHLSEDLSLKKIAEVFQISPDHLIRTFKKEKGMTFHQYVLLQRIFESKRMLKQHPEMSVTEVAYSVGFASSSQFSKMFKSVNGHTPSHYRQHVQTEQIL